MSAHATVCALTPRYSDTLSENSTKPIFLYYCLPSYHDDNATAQERSEQRFIVDFQERDK